MILFLKYVTHHLLVKPPLTEYDLSQILTTITIRTLLDMRHVSPAFCYVLRRQPALWHGIFSALKLAKHDYLVENAMSYMRTIYEETCQVNDFETPSHLHFTTESF